MSSKEEIKSKIRRDLNPGAGLTHNEGESKKAPHASKASTTAKFLTNCAEEHAASLKCIQKAERRLRILKLFAERQVVPSLDHLCHVKDFIEIIKPLVFQGEDNKSFAN